VRNGGEGWGALTVTLMPGAWMGKHGNCEGATDGAQAAKGLEDARKRCSQVGWEAMEAFESCEERGSAAKSGGRCRGGVTMVLSTP